MTDHSETLRYDGPATLRTRLGLRIELFVHLHTDNEGPLIEWGGSGTTHDLRVLGVVNEGMGGTLVLPDAREGDIYLPNIQIDADKPGVQLRLQGSGPAPYAAEAPGR